jgi:hypothetical protein
LLADDFSHYIGRRSLLGGERRGLDCANQNDEDRRDHSRVEALETGDLFHVGPSEIGWMMLLDQKYTGDPEGPGSLLAAGVQWICPEVPPGRF